MLQYLNLDRYRAFARHAVIAALPVVAAAVLTVIPGLQKQYAGDAVIGLVLTMATLYLTPLTRQYGAGYDRHGVAKK